MAYKLIWSPAALDDLHDIAVFIARDDSDRAIYFGYELISEIERLQEFLASGLSTETQNSTCFAQAVDNSFLRAAYQQLVSSLAVA